MKGGFFDKGTFKEAFMQLKVAGILFSVLGALTSILYTVGMIVDRVEYNRMINIMYESMGMGPSIEMEAFTVPFFYVLYVVAYLFVPMMVLMIFTFLTRRNACDFYHAVPVKRKAMYVSMVAAVMAWVVIIYASVCGFSMIITGIDPGMTMNMLEAGKIILETFVACILIVGVFCLGTALTGTGITNFVVSLMILAGPRVIMMLILAIFEDLIPYSEMGYGSFIFNNSYNIFFRLGEDFEALASVPMASTFIYSTILGIIYVCLGCVAFTKRKSETAAQATAHPAIQTVCKMVPSFMCALIGIMGIMEVIFNGEDNPTTFFAIAVLFIISVAVYLIYDVITNRKARSFVKSVKQLPIFFGVVAIAGVIIGSISYYERKWEPSADDIEKVEFFAMDYIYSYLGIEKVEVDNEEINKILVDAYNRQMKKYYEDNEYVYDEYYDEYYEEQVIVGIDTGLTTRYKRVNLTSKEYDAIMKACTEVVKENGYGIKLPKYNEGYTDVYGANTDLASKFQQKLYECLKKEVESKSISQVLDAKALGVVDLLRVRIDSDYGSARVISIPVGDNLPDTKKLLMEMAYESAKYYDMHTEIDGEFSNHKAVENWVEEYSNKESTKISISYVATNADVDAPRYLYINDEFTEEENDKFYSMMKKMIEEDKVVSDKAVVVYMDIEVPDRFFYEKSTTVHTEEADYYGARAVVAYKVSEETAKEFMSFVGTLDYMSEDEGIVEYEFYD